jgi:hypothetical protein
MPGFNIEAFKAEVNQKAGFQRTNRFLMTFPTPRLLVGLSYDGAFDGSGFPNMEVNRNIEMWCESITLPGYQLMTHDVRRWTYGPIEKRPFAPNFSQLQAVFLADGDGAIWRFFNDWTQSIIPHDTDRGINGPSKRGYSGEAYEVQYKSLYVTELNIYTYHENGDPIQNIVCREAFPSQIGDVSLNWGDNNNLVRLQITFDFLDWFSRPVTKADAPTPPPPTSSNPFPSNIQQTA